MAVLVPGAQAAPKKETRSKVKVGDRIQSKAEPYVAKDPFLPPLPVKTLKIRYKLEGRFEGQEVLAVKGERRVREVKARDNAFGLQREVHLWELETPDMFVRLDLISGRVETRPNLRGALSRLWQKLGHRERYFLNENLAQLPLILGRRLKIDPVARGEASSLGLPAVLAKLWSSQAWYWNGTDIVLQQAGQQGGQAWSKKAIDLVTDPQLDDELFSLPGRQGSDRPLAVDRAEVERTEFLAARIMTALVLPGLAQEKESKPPREAVESGSGRVPIPWPIPAPPGFRTPAERYRFNPRWAPFPPPPDLRAWPPPGQGRDILVEAIEAIGADLERWYKDQLSGP